MPKNHGLELLFGIAWLAFSIWTVRHLWRPSNSKFTQLVFFFGVKWIGLAACRT